MMKADEVEAMLRLHKLGWGTRCIAREFGWSRNTVKRTWRRAAGCRTAARVAAASWPVWTSGWRSVSCGTAATPRWCARELERELSIKVGVRTVERAVAPHRRLLEAEAKATVRFETRGASDTREILRL